MDNSIIDVAGESFSLSNLSSNNSAIHYWANKPVYSYSEIKSATNAQRVYYKTFKFNFLGGLYADLQGNDNYAFVLLYDFLNEYQDHRNPMRLEKQLRDLGNNYAVTRTYCLSSLIKKLEERDDRNAIERIRKEENYYVGQNNSDYWKLGTKNKTKLNLSNNDVDLLNKLWNPNNNFFNIEFCGLEIIKFYLYVIKKLDEKYQKESSSLNIELTKIADIIAQKHYRYRKGSENYNYSLQTILNDINFNIFKYCENIVRENYGQKRKLSTELQYASAYIKEEYDDKLILRLKKILEIYRPTILDPDEITDLELNALNSTRWKTKLDELSINYKNDSKKFIEDVVNLGHSNKNNPAVENIFFEAAKFMVNQDNEAALSLYIYYLYYDLKSAKFDNKPLNKTILKSLFKKSEQLVNFQDVVDKLIKDQNLQEALKSIPLVYTPKRKKIQLDRNAIQEVHEKHSGTVELLNEYLKDDNEEETDDFLSAIVDNEKLVLTIPSALETNKISSFDDSIKFSNIQLEILDIFLNENLSILQTDLEIFVKSKGMFRNQLVESINEICYDTLDDILIEEEDELYTINENYFNRILAI
ncbi:tellurite resistance TerB C-terminal domain-containing protein [Flavobacterium sp. Fl-318]|uniref:Tellurite resistance TerB C-terminal domain-containing protein n=1 Tax=Flavobacterium cupriresistens TaxID=2893885 RepID=A0ABU4R8B7_9FLAO|nr:MULTISPECIES: tellurite resistance TerB C-terminal domain-containing protein [unclassified Flavobacterium]MDX6188068.1 tellurite resistance TerB C-terminal domain-containing protein [Flavobacterium sp. Fl-318]UFH42012.1 hypothetical protein LNP23_19645 [Flavobacterium sp. F-323]